MEDLPRLKWAYYKRSLTTEGIDSLMGKHLGFLDGIILAVAHDVAWGFASEMPAQNKGLKTLVHVMLSELDSVGRRVHDKVTADRGGTWQWPQAPTPQMGSIASSIALFHGAGHKIYKTSKQIDWKIPYQAIKHQVRTVVAHIMPELRAGTWKESRLAFNHTSSALASASVLFT
jgi:hypothetical protein